MNRFRPFDEFCRPVIPTCDLPLLSNEFRPVDGAVRGFERAAMERNALEVRRRVDEESNKGEGEEEDGGRGHGCSDRGASRACGVGERKRVAGSWRWWVERTGEKDWPLEEGELLCDLEDSTREEGALSTR